jgi:UDP-N-acetylmuramate dehydrogenase
MARAATETQKAGLTGLEFGLAIPGTVGGAVWANAGAHGSDVKSIVESADVLLADGTESRLAAADLGLGYRESRFKVPGASLAAAATPDLVLAATFTLGSASSDEIKERLDDIRRWRQAHQPLGLPSAGSVFRNPPEGPSAGEIVEGLGLKGLRIGGAVVSEKHANFIVNDQKGTAAAVRALGEKVREEVARRAGVELVFEIVFLGDWGTAA